MLFNKPVYTCKDATGKSGYKDSSNSSASRIKRKFVEFALTAWTVKMSEISKLILLNKQHQEQMAVLHDKHCKQNKQHKEQMTMLEEQLKALQSSLNNSWENVPTLMARFKPFDSTSELWTDFWQGFEHLSLLTLFPTTSKHKFFLPINLTSFTKCLAT